MQKTKWLVKVDWYNIVEQLSLDSIDQIPEYKLTKAISKVEKDFSIEQLEEMEPNMLEAYLFHELRKLLQKELAERNRKKREVQNSGKIIPLKNGGIIKIDASDFKKMKGDEKGFQEMLKGMMDNFTKSEDEEDDENEDSTGYYI